METLCREIEAAGFMWLVRNDEQGVYFANITVRHHSAQHTKLGAGCCFPKYADTAVNALSAAWGDCRAFHGLVS